MFLERFVSKTTDIFVTVSFLNQKEAIQKKLGKPEQFVNIYGGIDFKKFDIRCNIAEKKRELGIGNTVKVVGFVGRLVEQKAPHDFIHAISMVLKSESNVYFLVVGDGEMRNDLQKLASDLQISKYLKILGFREDISAILKILNVFVMSSLWEGLSRSLTEAMYIGCPVVATAVGGTPELVIDGVTGILVKPNDVQGIAHGIIDLLNGEKKVNKMCMAARKKVVDNFSSEKMFEHFDQLYQTRLRSLKSLSKID